VGRAKFLFTYKLFLPVTGTTARHVGSAFLLTTTLVILAMFTATVPVRAQAAADEAVQVAQSHGRGYHNLREGLDIEMQRMLRKAVRDLDLDDAIEDKRLSVALVDVTEPEYPRMAMLNGDEMMYAASLPKIAILFGAFQKAHEGRLRLDSNMREQMTNMIRFSSNEAATYVLNKVGRSYLAGLLQSRNYRFYDANFNGGLWVGKAYASGSAYQRDPLHNISHGATSYQVARFLYMLETGRLVSPEYSRQMKDIMGDPGIHHKFVKGIEEFHPDARIYRKSGTWREYHADGAIIERAGRRYIAVALAEDRKGGEWLQSLIVAMDAIVFSRPRPIQAASLH
jgi:beta-lactamase class A